MTDKTGTITFGKLQVVEFFNGNTENSNLNKKTKLKEFLQALMAEKL